MNYQETISSSLPTVEAWLAEKTGKRHTKVFLSSLARIMTETASGRIEGWGKFGSIEWETSLNDSTTKILLWL